MHPSEEPGGFGLYVHVPYCRRVCPYCDFNVAALGKADPWSALLDAYRRELDARASLFESQALRSVYLGGGTPSLMPSEYLEELLGTLWGHWTREYVQEVTIELDPSAWEPQALARWRDAGVTRVSLGWQGTDDSLLKVLGRGHDSNASEHAYAAIRQANFQSVSVDLIFAVPGQTLAGLEGDLNRIAELSPDHVSLYNLTYHEGTPFYAWRGQGRIRPLEEATEAAMMETAVGKLCELGFEQYEVSNFARPGHRSIHNSGYWSGSAYLGVGPGAHSYLPHGDAGYRWESVRAPIAYADASFSEGMPGDDETSWQETLTPLSRWRDELVGKLRTPVPISATFLAKHCSQVPRLLDQARSLDWLSDEGDGCFALTPRGLMNADAVAALFMDASQ